MSLSNLGNQLQSLYVAYFGRPGDVNGMQFWSAVISAGRSDTSAVASAFAASGEYQAAYAGKSTDQVIDAVYVNLFSHSPDPAGLAFWRTAMNSGAMSTADVVITVAAGAQGSDKVAFDAKVHAAGAFTTELATHGPIIFDPAPPPASFNLALKAFISGVYDATTLAAAIDPAALTLKVDQIIGAPHVAAAFEHVDGVQATLIGASPQVDPAVV